MKKIFVVSFILIFSLFPICAGADVIDFETGFAEGNSVGTVITATNQVTFFSRAYPPTNNYTNANIAEVGGDGPYAFRNEQLDHDTPSGAGAGSYFLTDRNSQSSAESYFIRFSNPVADISLDLYDFDNGNTQAVLTGYSDTIWSASASVGTDTVLSSLGDGSVVNLSVTDPSTVIYSASLTWINGTTIDDETGIDNISFTTVPIPSAVWLLGSGLIGLVGVRRKFRTA